MEKQDKMRDDLTSDTLPSQEHVYELEELKTTSETSVKEDIQPAVMLRKLSVWSLPFISFIVLAVLLSLILVLLVIILALVLTIGVNTTAISTAASTGTSNSINFTEWAEDITEMFDRKFPNFAEWAEDLVYEVNTNVTQSFPNFTEWAEHVVEMIGRTFPNFTEWANSIVYGVNTNVTKSLPNFTEWSNGVVSKVNTNVTQSLPNFNEWSDGVVSEVSDNLTQGISQWIDVVAQNTFQLLHNFSNFNKLSEKILVTSRDSSREIIYIVNTLSKLQDISTSTAGIVDDILIALHNNLPTSCEEIKSKHPSSQSGYYLLTTVGNHSATYTAYCNMGKLCGSGGGWTRLAYLNMSDAIQNCPSGFKLYQRGNVRACGRYGNGASCTSVQFPSNKMSYSQVCGRVIGYQYGHTDSSFYYYRNNLNSYYVDGVSITRGSPRQHVWTLISGFSSSSAASSSCPCNNGSTVTVSSFIGKNYFCESGNYGSASIELYTSDPLWDGQGCGSLETACCNAPGLPWFHRDYGSTTTTDYLELRVCADEGANGEDAPVSYYEIYVK